MLKLFTDVTGTSNGATIRVWPQRRSVHCEQNDSMRSCRPSVRHDNARFCVPDLYKRSRGSGKQSGSIVSGFAGARESFPERQKLCAGNSSEDDRVDLQPLLEELRRGRRTNVALSLDYQCQGRRFLEQLLLRRQARSLCHVSHVARPKTEDVVPLYPYLEPARRTEVGICGARHVRVDRTLFRSHVTTKKRVRLDGVSG